jgi:hypothetical protein
MSSYQACAVTNCGKSGLIIHNRPQESCSTSSTSFLAELPSRNKANFAHCQPNDSRRKQAPKTYIPLNDTSPPPDQGA